jgi:hypothetical protein
MLLNTILDNVHNVPAGFVLDGWGESRAQLFHEPPGVAQVITLKKLIRSF